MSDTPTPPAGRPPNEEQFFDIVEKSVYRQKAVKGPPSREMQAPAELLGQAATPPAPPVQAAPVQAVPGAPPVKQPNEEQFFDMVEKSVYRQKAVKPGDVPPGVTPPPAAAPAGPKLGGFPTHGPPPVPPSDDEYQQMVDKSVYRQQAIPKPAGSARPAGPSGRAPQSGSPPWLLPVVIALGVLVIGLVVIWQLSKKG